MARTRSGPGHGFVVAYDVRGLNRDPGFTPTPAIWNVTPGGGAGGVWMSGSGPAIDGDDIYLATGNGMDPGTMPGNFGESFVKLRYTAGVSGVNNGKPKLAVFDYWGAFSDFRRDSCARTRSEIRILALPVSSSSPSEATSWEAAKMAFSTTSTRTTSGRTTWDPQFNLPFVATYLPNAPNGAAGLPTTTVPDPNWPIVNRDRNLPTQTPTGKIYHIHGTPVYMERAYERDCVCLGRE